MSEAPNIATSTESERREYIKKRFPCISDCDMCGFCAVFHGRDPEYVYDDYIIGKRSFQEINEGFQRGKKEQVTKNYDNT